MIWAWFHYKKLINEQLGKFACHYWARKVVYKHLASHNS